jgi:lipid II:glycine glycyltransferase (peptidoglycan interpeptide bridge formation enzyme)
MACHTLFLTSQSEFFNKLKSREPDLVIKMVKCVLNAIKRKRDKVDIFDITFKDTSELVFSLEKNQYHDLLKNYLNDLIAIEEYEICAEIKKQLDKAPKKQKPAKI